MSHAVVAARSCADSRLVPCTGKYGPLRRPSLSFCPISSIPSSQSSLRPQTGRNNLIMPPLVCTFPPSHSFPPRLPSPLRHGNHHVPQTSPIAAAGFLGQLALEDGVSLLLRYGMRQCLWPWLLLPGSPGSRRGRTGLDAWEATEKWGFSYVWTHDGRRSHQAGGEREYRGDGEEQMHFFLEEIELCWRRAKRGGGGFGEMLMGGVALMRSLLGGK